MKTLLIAALALTGLTFAAPTAEARSRDHRDSRHHYSRDRHHSSYSRHHSPSYRYGYGGSRYRSYSRYDGYYRPSYRTSYYAPSRGYYSDRYDYYPRTRYSHRPRLAISFGF